MVETKLQIGVALAQNAEEYLRFLVWTLDRTCVMPRRFILGVNEGADIDVVKSIIDGHDADVFDARVSGGYGSMNHGMCLDAIFNRMSTGLGMLVDCDVAFLQQGWDAEIASLIVRDGATIVGAEYDGDKYLGFPNVICAMFNVGDIAAAGVSFMPEGMITLDSTNCELYGYSASQCPRTIMLDTGSQLPRKLKLAGRRGIPMPIFRSGHKLARFMIEGLRGEEYQLAGTPICTHLGRSFTRPFGVDSNAIAWEKRVREFIV